MISAHRGATAVLMAATLSLLVLTLMVGAGKTHALDVWARDLMRPGNEWGELQMKADWVVEGLRPRNAIAITAIAGAAVTIRRWSWWPLLQVSLVLVGGGLLTLIAKFVMRRRDTSGEIGGIGGSYPSGHVVCAIMLASCLVLLLSREPAKLVWILGPLSGAFMGYCLLVQAAHWLTDVMGGMLLGIAVVAGARLWTWRPIRDAESTGLGVHLNDSG